MATEKNARRDEASAGVTGEIDRRSQGLADLSLRIHANPETGFQETRASEWLTRYLEDAGFVVERGICDLPTAFRSAYGNGRPSIALVAEYDALPGLGHACGHNLIAVAAVGAAIGAKIAVDRFGGSVRVIGTPAEELYGGKVIMLERGAFTGLDAAMMVHPGTRNTANTSALACQGLKVEFTGKAAHAAARPEAGINALEAMLLSFTAINALRQHIRGSARIHGIITDGGTAANVVPAHSAGDFIVRARDMAYLEELKGKVLSCFAGAAMATGARLDYQWDDVYYAPMRSNPVLAGLYAQHMESFGHRVRMTGTDGFGSTDMSNVSQVVPAIHPSFAIADRATAVIHSPEFAQAAASDEGIRAMLDAAKSLAMTVVDLLSDSSLVNRVREAFEQGQ